MTVTVVRPNGTPSGGGLFTVTGAATAHAALSDNTDASYIRKTGSGTAAIILGFGSTAVGTTQVVKQVRIRARVQSPTSSSKLNIQLGARIGGVNYFHPALAVRGVVATGEVVGQWFSSAPDGSAWSQATIDALRAQVTEYKDAGDRGYVYEVYIDVDISTQSTVTVATPTGTLTATAKPDVTWSVTDPDGDPPQYYQVKVFSDAKYGAAGFDPTTATADWDSSQVPSGDVSATVNVSLLNGTYRAYVRSGKAINGIPFWSGWAFSGFVLSLTPPAVPTLVVNYNPTTNAVTLTATGSAPTGFDYQQFDFDKSTDGVTWYPVRYGYALQPDSANVEVLTDNEPARAVTMRYRVRTTGVVGTNVQTSAWSTVATVGTSNDYRWIIKTLEPEPQVVTGVRITGPLGWEQPEQVGTFTPLGRAYPVVLTHGVQGRAGDFTVVTIGSTEYTDVWALLAYTGTLFIQSPFGDDIYVRVVARNVVRDGFAGNPRHEITVGYVEVQG